MHLKAAQFFRYFVHQKDSQKKELAMRTDEDTLVEADEGTILDDMCHRNFDLQCSRVGVGAVLKCAAELRAKTASAKRRHNRDFCVARSAFLEPCGKDRDAFYEQRLLLGLPWHCYQKPLTGSNHQNNSACWFSRQLLRAHRMSCGGSV